MKRLIVNADDFGLTEGVNRAILEGYQAGIITNASLLANGDAFGPAVEAVAGMATLGVGVHLNLMDGPPVCDPARVDSLLGAKGVFPGSPGIVAKRVLTGKIKLAEVEAEWRSQIEKIVAAGVRISHLDSHKHIHLLPPLFNLVIKLAREYQISCVRCPVEPWEAGWGTLAASPGNRLGTAKQFTVARGLSMLAARQSKKLRRAGICWPERFYGLSQTGFLDAGGLRRLLVRLPVGTSELICHPGYVDSALLGIRTRLRSQRATELVALTQPGLRGLVAELGIELITYGKLAGKESAGAEPLGEKKTSSVQEIARRA